MLEARSGRDAGLGGGGGGVGAAFTESSLDALGAFALDKDEEVYL